MVIIMRITPQHIETEYNSTKSYVLTDSEMAMLAFVIKGSFHKDESNLKNMNKKKYNKAEDEMKVAKAAILRADGMIKELQEVKAKIMSLGVYELDSSIKSAENKIMSEAASKLSTAIKIVNKYNKYYACHYRRSLPPNKDKYGNSLKRSNYTIKIDDRYNFSPSNVLIDLGLGGNSKEIINKSCEKYFKYYSERYHKNKKNNPTEQKVWNVPEVSKIKEMLKSVEDDNDKKKLQSALEVYKALELSKYKLYNYQTIVKVLKNTILNSDEFKYPIEKFSNLEKECQKQIEKYEEIIKSKSFEKKESEVNKVERKVELSQNLNDIQSQIKEKEAEIEKAKSIIVELKDLENKRKINYDSKVLEAYKTKHIPAKIVTETYYRVDGEESTWEREIPSHDEYVYEEHTRNFIMGTSKEDLDEVRKRLNQQEGILANLKEQLEELKSMKQELNLKKESLKQEYRKKSLLERAKERLKNKNQNNSMKM